LSGRGIVAVHRCAPRNPGIHPSPPPPPAPRADRGRGSRPRLISRDPESAHSELLGRPFPRGARKGRIRRRFRRAGPSPPPAPFYRAPSPQFRAERERRTRARVPGNMNSTRSFLLLLLLLLLLLPPARRERSRSRYLAGYLRASFTPDKHASRRPTRADESGSAAGNSSPRRGRRDTPSRCRREPRERERQNSEYRARLRV